MIFIYARFVLVLLAACVSADAWAFRLGVAGGTVGVSNGHPNAADFRSISNYKLHATVSNIDVSIAPTHALVGRVFTFKTRAYVIPAAGFIIDGNGSGPGVAASFGWTAFCFGVCPFIEFQNLIGFGPRRQMVSGTAARVGLDYRH